MKKSLLNVAAFVSLALAALACDGAVIATGETGEVGPRGPKGERGAVGAPGGVGDLSVREAHASGRPGDLVVASAACDDGAGERAIDGGCTWGKYPGNVHAHSTAPVVAPDGTLGGWSCSGLVGTEVEHDEMVTAYVVCELRE